MTNNYKRDRARLSAEIKAIGVRAFAKRAKVSPMRVSRYVNNAGSDHQWILYQLAAALGYDIRLVTNSIHAA